MRRVKMVSGGACAVSEDKSTGNRTPQTTDMGIACGPGFALIRLQALSAGLVPAAIPNASNSTGLRSAAGG